MSLTVNIIHLAQVVACHTPNQLLWPIILATVGAILVFSGASAPGIVVVASTMVQMLVPGASFDAIAAGITAQLSTIQTISASLGVVGALVAAVKGILGC